MGHVAFAPPAPESPRRASGQPLAPCGHGVTKKGNALQLCGLGSGRGRVRALRRDLALGVVRPIR